jgi:hypothetical protein
MFPDGAPVRQWVLSLPMQIRYRLAHDGKLLSDVLRILIFRTVHCCAIRWI